jgi:hypothetical protein
MIWMLRWVQMVSARSSNATPEPVAAGDFGSDVVVTAAQIPHDGVTGGEDPRRTVAFQAAHRPQPGLQPPMICLDRIIGVLRHGMQGRGNQLIEHPRVHGRAAGGDPSRDGARG